MTVLIRLNFLDRLTASWKCSSTTHTRRRCLYRQMNERDTFPLKGVFKIQSSRRVYQTIMYENFFSSIKTLKWQSKTQLRWMLKEYKIISAYINWSAEKKNDACIIKKNSKCWPFYDTSCSIWCRKFGMTVLINFILRETELGLFLCF